MVKENTYSSPEAVCLKLNAEHAVLQASHSSTNEGFTDYPTGFELE